MKKKIFIVIAYLFSIANLHAQDSCQSTMKHIVMMFMLAKNGTPTYAVFYKNKPVILPSSLGFKLEDGIDFSKNFKIISTQRRMINENWQPVWGEVKTINNHCEELTVHLQQQDSKGLLLNIIFRVFEEGVGFRYEFPKQAKLTYFIVADELTGFNLAGDHKTFWIPGDYDSNEYPYTTSALSKINTTEIVEKSTEIAVRTNPDKYSVQTPLMMKSADGLYINIHEASLVNYPAMQLHVNTNEYKLISALVPDAVGNKAYLRAPCVTPWRTVIVSDKAASILNSKMILNLNEPSKIENTSWIKPMKFVGVWWEMQTGVGTWSYSDYPDSINSKGQLIPNKKHSANTANVKRYIDFAAKNGIQAVLVEGWYTGWEDWFGKWKENVFDFVTPYPDFNVKELVAYAASKNVKLIMHNETSGSATNYERQMDTSFQFMKANGYGSVKTGYVGKIIPRGEHHDGQWMVNHYQRVAEKAAAYHIMVDMHEPVRPTGQYRTWPNWLACEAARGNEFNAFSIGNPPEHETILPFTRLMGGPMDYTPGIFKLKNYAANPNLQVHTTLAKQLALYVTMYSPLQMAADLPENYEAHMDAFQFIKDVPVDWDDTKIIEAEPGDYVTIARKEKGMENWFIGAITDENSRYTIIPLDFLNKGVKYIATIYSDAPNTDWKNDPGQYVIEKVIVSSVTKLHIKLAAGGGVAISIKPAAADDLKVTKQYAVNN